MLNVNHGIKVGEIISSEGEQVAIAGDYEVYTLEQESITVGESTIRILGCSDTRVINTNYYNDRGIVCFLPKEYRGCAILKVKVTRVHNKSIEAIPLDYLKADKPIESDCSGMTAHNLLQDTTFPNIKRIKVESQPLD